MPEHPTQLFHCSDCGELVPVGMGAERVCEKCGKKLGRVIPIAPRAENLHRAHLGQDMVQRDVAIRRHSKAWVAPADSEEESSQSSSQPKLPLNLERSGVSAREKKIRRQLKKRKVNSFAPLFHLGGWSALIMLIIIGVKTRMDTGVTEPDSEKQMRSAIESSMQEQIRRLLDQETPALKDILRAYLSEPDWTGRAQLVSQSARVAPKMQRHYQRAALWQVIPNSRVTVVKANVIAVSGDKPVIEMLFRVEPFQAAPDIETRSEPYSREVVFLREENRWAIDWEALVRYSDQPLASFYRDTEGNPTSSEFRVYVRQIATREQQGNPAMTLKFYEPREDSEEIWKQNPPSVLVRKDSESGRQFLKVLSRDTGETLPGQPRLWHSDPGGFRRVRVQLGWKTDEKGQRSVEVEKFFAGDWFSSAYEGRLLPGDVTGGGD